MEQTLLRWVKASERTPNTEEELFIKLNNSKITGSFVRGVWYDDIGEPFYAENIEWLEETTTQEQPTAEQFNSIHSSLLPQYFVRYPNKEGLTSACLHFLGDDAQRWHAQKDNLQPTPTLRSAKENYKHWFKTNLLALIGGEVAVAKKQNRSTNFDFLDAWIDKNYPTETPTPTQPKELSQISTENVTPTTNSLSLNVLPPITEDSKESIVEFGDKAEQIYKEWYALKDENRLNFHYEVYKQLVAPLQSQLSAAQAEIERLKNISTAYIKRASDAEREIDRLNKVGSKIDLEKLQAKCDKLFANPNIEKEFEQWLAEKREKGKDVASVPNSDLAFVASLRSTETNLLNNSNNHQNK